MIKYKQSVLFVLVVVSLAAVTQSLAQKEAGSASAFEQILKSGQVMSRIYFEANSSKLGPEAKKELDRRARELSRVSGSFIIRIEGYTDSSFEREKDVLLSMQRAQAVKLYLLAKHPNLKIDFYMTGFGSRRPIVPIEGESQEALRKRERRVEMVLYPGADFFAGKEGVEVISRLKAAEVPVAEVPVAEVPVAEVPVAEAPVAEAPVSPEIVARARAFKRIVLPAYFFDNNDNLLAGAKPVLEDVLKKVRDSSAWLFVSADTALGLEQNRELRRQLLLTRTLVEELGIASDRIFVKGFSNENLVKDSAADFPGEVSIYIPIQ